MVDSQQYEAKSPSNIEAGCSLAAVVKIIWSKLVIDLPQFVLWFKINLIKFYDSYTSGIVGLEYKLDISLKL